jgi:hypothetical protein
MTVNGPGPPVRLNLNPARQAASPEWIEIPGGVRLLLLPRSALLEAAVQTRIGQELAAFRAGAPNLAHFGFDPAEATKLLDPELGASFAGFLITVVEASVYVAEWNLVDEAGVAIPITPKTVAALFRDGLSPGTGWFMIDAFARAIEERNLREAAPADLEAVV